jgi:hypothetical protein
MSATHTDIKIPPLDVTPDADVTDPVVGFTQRLQKLVAGLGYRTIHEIIQAGPSAVAYDLPRPYDAELPAKVKAYVAKARGINDAPAPSKVKAAPKPPPPPEPSDDALPTLESIRDVLGDEYDDAKTLALRLIMAKNDAKLIQLAIQGSDHPNHKNSYEGPRIIGLENQIQALLGMYGLTGFRIEDWVVYTTDTTRTYLSKERLLDLGVDAETIAAAHVTTPVSSLTARKVGGGRKGGLLR